jgi:rubrerythrin
MKEGAMGLIDDAIRLEERAERGYRAAADLAKGAEARRFLLLLADAEVGHAAALKALANVADIVGPDLVTAAKQWVRGAVEGGARSLSPDSRLLGVLRQAMDLERETETFYREHAARQTDPRVANLLSDLSRIENAHYQLLSSLVEYYNRPHEWVESAEFGLRPEY